MGRKPGAKKPGASRGSTMGHPAGLMTLDGIYKILHISLLSHSKLVEFRGSALDDLRAFPVAARREVADQLDQVQQGGEPDDWRPMRPVGPGAREIRVRDETGAFRVIYVAKFSDAVYVLNFFQKKTEKKSARQI